MISVTKREVASMLYSKGAFMFGAFKLKLHEKTPDAPLSPIYINIRNKDNPKPGPLDSNDYDLIAKCLLEVIHERSLNFDAIAGIPRAGDPIVDAIERVKNTMPDLDLGGFRIIRLAKEETENTRKIVPMQGFEYIKGERILLIDDLVTKADTKLEAIRAVESSGSEVVGLVVLIDREQGGRKQLEAAGCKMYSALTISDLLDLYKYEGLVDKDKYDEAVKYVTTV